MTKRKRPDFSPAPYMGRAKTNTMYKKLDRNPVAVLRTMVRDTGYAKWYTYRKSALVSTIVLHRSVNTIVRLFRRCTTEGRERVLAEKRLDGSVCPISLIPVSDLKEVFVHNGTVFSREDIIEYFRSSMNFSNPITRNDIHAHEVARIGDRKIARLFRHRRYLRNEEINKIQHFAYLEEYLENVLVHLIRQYHHRYTELFTETAEVFRDTWVNMRDTDRNRTLCVLKSLFQTASLYGSAPRNWAKVFITGYLRLT